MSFTELDEFKATNPELRQVIKAPKIIRGTGVQVDSGFRDVLTKISKDYPRNNMNIPGVKTRSKGGY